MLVNLSLLFGLLWRPMTVVQQLRDRAPVAFAVFAAWLMTFLYGIVASALFAYAEGGTRDEVLIDGGFGSSFHAFSGAARDAAMVVLFVAVVYVPCAILIANL